MEMSRIFFFCLMIISSTAEPVENIRVLVGGNITLREPVNEDGFLSYKDKLIALVFNGIMKTREERFNKKVMWNNRTRFFTITNIQKNYSGTYYIDNVKSEIRRFILSVYDPLPPPSVRRSNEDPALCSLLCYVDGAPPLTSVVWMKGQEVMNQSSSYSSVLLTIPEQDLNSSLTCAAQSPAENKTVKVTTWCGDNNKDNNNNNNTNNNNRHRLWLILILVSVCAVVVLIVCVITGKCFIWKRKHTQETMTSEPDITYAEVKVSSDSEDPVSSPDVSTVYSKIQTENDVCVCEFHSVQQGAVAASQCGDGANEGITAGSLVQSETSGTEPTQDSGDDRGLQEESPPTPPFTILNSKVSTVDSFRFLGSTISQHLKWTSHIDTTRKKAQQRMYFLCQLRKFNLLQELLIMFYTSIIQSVQHSMLHFRKQDPDVLYMNVQCEQSDGVRVLVRTVREHENVS